MNSQRLRVKVDVTTAALPCTSNPIAPDREVKVKASLWGSTRVQVDRQVVILWVLVEIRPERRAQVRVWGLRVLRVLSPKVKMEGRDLESRMQTPKTPQL